MTSGEAVPAPTRSSATTVPGTVSAALHHWAAAGATGALTVTGTPGGVIFLVEGLVSAVESRAAPDVGQLLIGHARVTRQEWDAIRHADEPPWTALVAGGTVTAAELELCALDALYDAAYFALGTDPAEVHFHEGARCRSAPETGVSAAELSAGIDRQRRTLDAVHPSDQNDHSPVVPVPRPGLDRVFLSGLQWEIVLHADGTRTPIDLANLLGRSAFAVILDVRRLVSTGLVERHPARVRPNPQPSETPSVAPAGVGHDEVGRRAPRAEVADESAPPSVPGPKPAALPVLPRRVPGGALADTFHENAETTGRAPGAADPLAALPGMASVSADDSILRRIRSALQALR